MCNNWPAIRKRNSRIEFWICSEDSEANLQLYLVSWYPGDLTSVEQSSVFGIYCSWFTFYNAVLNSQIVWRLTLYIPASCNFPCTNKLYRRPVRQNLVVWAIRYLSWIVWPLYVKFIITMYVSFALFSSLAIFSCILVLVTPQHRAIV